MKNWYQKIIFAQNKYYLDNFLIQDVEKEITGANVHDTRGYLHNYIALYEALQGKLTPEKRKFFEKRFKINEQKLRDFLAKKRQK